MKTYWLLGNKNYSVQNDSLVCHWNPTISKKKKMESSQRSVQQVRRWTSGWGSLPRQQGIHYRLGHVEIASLPWKQRALLCANTALMCVSLCQQGGVGAAPATQSPAVSWDELSLDTHTRRSSRPDWSPESVTHGVSQKQRNGFHHSSQQSLQENLPSLGLPALGEGDKGANLEHRSYGTKTTWKNELLPGFVAEMWQYKNWLNCPRHTRLL